MVNAGQFEDSLFLNEACGDLEVASAGQVRPRAVVGLIKEANQEWQACRFDNAVQILEKILAQTPDSSIRVAQVKCQNLHRLRCEILKRLQEPTCEQDGKDVGAQVAAYLAELALESLRDDEVQSLFDAFHCRFSKAQGRAEVHRVVSSSLALVGGVTLAIGLVAGVWFVTSWRAAVQRDRAALRQAIASKNWDRALVLDPTNVQALLGRARKSMDAVPADLDAALHDIRLAEQTHKSSEEVRRLRSIVLVKRALKAAGDGRIEEAEVDLLLAEQDGVASKQIVEVNEAIATTWLARAEAAAHQQDSGKLKQASVAATKSRRNVRRIRELWCLQAEACTELTDLSGFVEACQEASRNGLSAAELASLWLAFGATALENRNSEALNAAIETLKMMGVHARELQSLKAGSIVLRSLSLAQTGQLSEATDAVMSAGAIDAKTVKTLLVARDLTSLRGAVNQVCQSRVASYVDGGKIYEAVAIMDEAAPFFPRASHWLVQILTLDRLRTLSPEVLASLPPGTLAAAVAVLPVTEEIMLPVMVNSIGMRLKLLHAGTFVMGGNQGDGKKESPQVTLTRRFYLGTHEVTNAEWRRVTGEVPSKWKEDDLPVEEVTWTEAIEFCRKLSATPEEKILGRVYRLPTEAEWEFACRAGTGSRRSFGDDRTQDLGEYAWYGGNAGGTPHPVGQKMPNEWGFFDMYGNVWEWCSDWYGPLPPGRLIDPEGPSVGDVRVYRGGSWGSQADRCQSSNRDGYAPTHRQSHLGFRVALNFQEPEESGSAQ